MKTKPSFYKWTLFFALALFVGGCSLNKGPHTPTKLDLAKDRKKKRDQLYQELSQKGLKAGTSADLIREKFGEPDDIFKSGSSSSNFEIWTYDKMLVHKEDTADWESILLYFDNNHLVTWKF